MIITNDHQRQVGRSLQVDGINDICVGLSFLTVAFDEWIHHTAAASIANWSSLAAVVFLLLAVYSSRVLKARLVYPRSGYAAPRLDKRRMVAAVAVSAGFVVTGIDVLIIHPLDDRIIVIAGAILLCAGYLMMFVRLGFARYLAVAATLPIVAVVLAVSHVGWAIYPLFWLMTGVITVVGGLFALVSLLRTAAGEAAE